jgi:hypothetical protein
LKEILLLRILDGQEEVIMVVVEIIKDHVCIGIGFVGFTIKFVWNAPQNGFVVQHANMVDSLLHVK